MALVYDGDSGDGYGYGYGDDETNGPIIEQTSSSPHHYELIALFNELAQIKEILLQSHQASEALRAEAESVLQAHAQGAQEYLQQVDQPEPIDYFPFIAMPAGTTVRDLPDGGRLFTLADGVLVRANADNSIVCIGLDASAVMLDPARGGIVTLPDGRELTLHPSVLTATHEAAGIEGLPLDIDPVLVAEGRYRIDLPAGFRLDVNQEARLATICNPTGTIDILGIVRIEGVGEKIAVRLLAGGAKGFTCEESGHGGLIETNGAIHLSLNSGQDLIIRFPDVPEQPEDGSNSSDEPCALICERRDS
jgi:hypothetical protein